MSTNHYIPYVNHIESLPNHDYWMEAFLHEPVLEQLPSQDVVERILDHCPEGEGWYWVRVVTYVDYYEADHPRDIAPLPTMFSTHEEGAKLLVRNTIWAHRVLARPRYVFPPWPAPRVPLRSENYFISDTGRQTYQLRMPNLPRRFTEILGGRNERNFYFWRSELMCIIRVEHDGRERYDLVVEGPVGTNVRAAVSLMTRYCRAILTGSENGMQWATHERIWGYHFSLP